jgi:Ca2+-dependent lipid-binding protein
MKQETVVVRVYVLRGIGLVPCDKDGTADPYITITNGSPKGAPGINDSANVIENTLNPGFYKCFEFEMQMPCENTEIHISVWDWEKALLDFDDLVGTTKIDLADR